MSSTTEAIRADGPCRTCQTEAQACSWSQNPAAGWGDCCDTCHHFTDADMERVERACRASGFPLTHARYAAAMVLANERT